MVELMITGNYDNYTVAGIETEVARLLEQLEIANQTLNNVTIQLSEVEELEQIVQEATEGAAVVAEQAGEADLTSSKANDTIQRADALGMENRQRAKDVLAQSTKIARQSEQSESEFQQVVANYTALQTDVNATYSEEFDNLQTAERLQNEANQLNATANAISVDDILGLLNEYSAETERVESLTNEVAALQQEAEALTESFNEAAERLQRCYKTP